MLDLLFRLSKKTEYLCSVWINDRKMRPVNFLGRAHVYLILDQVNTPPKLVFFWGGGGRMLNGL